MPLITAMEPQKRKGRRNVFLDGVFWAGLTDFVVIKHGLRSGKELDEAEVRQILYDEEYEKQLKYAFRLLAGSDRTQKELASRLKKRQVPEDVSAAVLSKLEGYGLVGDADYMKKFVENKRGYGYYYYRERFREKGITPEESREILDGLLTPELEKEYAREFLETRRRKLQAFDERTRRLKAAALLKSRGFRGPALYAGLKGLTGEEDS